MAIRLLTEADTEPCWQLRLRALKEDPESFGASYEESIKLPGSAWAERIKPTATSVVFGAFDTGANGSGSGSG